MKRAHEDDDSDESIHSHPALGTQRKQDWFARVTASSLPADMWRLIAARLALQPHLALSRVCVATYHVLGDFVQILNKSVAEHGDQSRGREGIDARTLLHPLRWALWSNDWAPMNTFEAVLGARLATLPVRRFLRQMPEPLKWVDSVMVAGGFVRSLLLDVLRGALDASLFQAPQLSRAYSDVDIWLDDTTLDRRVIRAWINTIFTMDAGKYPDGQRRLDCPDRFTWDFDYEDCSLQCILTSGIAFHNLTGDPAPKDKTPMGILNHFDFSCVQMALMGHWFSCLEAGQCIVSPLAVWGLFTGMTLLLKNIEPIGHVYEMGMLPLFHGPIVKAPGSWWPLCLSDAEWDREKKDARIGGQARPRLLTRALKYLKRGYTIHGWSERVCERIRQRIPVVKNQQDVLSLTRDPQPAEGPTDYPGDAERNQNTWDKIRFNKAIINE